jgi:hypothetical protein
MERANLQNNTPLQPIPATTQNELGRFYDLLASRSEKTKQQQSQFKNHLGLAYCWRGRQQRSFFRRMRQACTNQQDANQDRRPKTHAPSLKFWQTKLFRM